jgi:hypothetical protein
VPLTNVSTSTRVPCLLLFSGDAVAKFASQNLHKRLINEESYREKQYETALKRAFIGTDEDILASEQHSPSLPSPVNVTTARP